MNNLEYIAGCHDGNKAYNLFRNTDNGELVRFYMDGTEAEASDLDAELASILE